MPPKHVFNHLLFFDGVEWRIYHKLDKRIPKNVDCYPKHPIVSADRIEVAIELAMACGIGRWDIQIINNDLSENLGIAEVNS